MPNGRRVPPFCSELYSGDAPTLPLPLKLSSRFKRVFYLSGIPHFVSFLPYTLSVTHNEVATADSHSSSRQIASAILAQLSNGNRLHKLMTTSARMTKNRLNIESG
jgi:hypothetical protein